MRSYLKKGLSVLLSVLLAFSIIPQGIFASAGTVYVDRKADAVFVIDATGSMTGCITSVKTNLSEFISLLDEDGVDVRTRFIVYRDITCSEETEMSSWFTSTDAAIAYLDSIVAYGGGDGPETPLDGIGQMFLPDFGFRTTASRFCILLTDADYKKNNNRGIKEVENAVDRLRAEDINTSVITRTNYFSLYEPLVSPGHSVTGEDKGILADIYGDYSILLKGFADAIINSSKTAVVERMEPYFGEVGISHNVTVTASNLSYDEDFAVTFDGEPIEVVKKEAGYFTFNTPADKPVGEYEVEITNGGGLKSSAGKFMVLASPEDDEPFIYGATPYKFEEGVDTTITVSGRNFINPIVFLGDKMMFVSSFTESTITINTGDAIRAGRYQLEVVNDNGKSAIAPEYFNIYYGELSEPHTITSVSPTEFYEHTPTELTITGTKFVSPKVKLDKTELEIISSSETQITCKVDDTFSHGTYHIKVICNGIKIALYNSVTVKERKLATPHIYRGKFHISPRDGSTLYWEAEEGEYFELYRRTPGYGKVLIGTTTDLELLDATSELGVEYYYSVKAYGTINGYPVESDFSNEFRLSYVVGTPTITSAEYNEDDNTVVLNWDSVEHGDVYEIFRSTTATGTKTLLGESTDTTFTDLRPEAGNKYFYFVRAKSAKCDLVGDYSSYKTVTIPAGPDYASMKPVIESAEYADDKVTIKIEALDDVTGFNVYRSTTATGTKTTLGTTSTLTFEDSTVAAGTKYFYFVKGVGADGTETEYSAYKAVTVPAAPAVADLKPEIESAEYADGKVTLTIKELDDVVSYTVYRSTTATGTKTTLGTTSTLTYEDSTAAAGTKYFYFVKAVGADGTESAYSAYKAVTVPAAPTVEALKPEIESAEYADGKVTLTIKALDDAASYTVYRSATATGIKTTLGTTTTTTYEDATVEAGKKYFYFVKATGTDGKESEYSAYKAVTVPAAPAVADLKPVIESAVAADGKVTVTIAALDDVTGFKVYRSTTATGTKTTLGTTTSTTYEDATVEAGKKYFYFVKAVGADGTESEYSAYKAVTVPAAPAVADLKPVIESAVAADGKVTVTIAALDDVTGFKVYRSTTATGTKTNLGTTSTLTFEDSTVAAGTKYFYFVKAVGADGTESAYSAYKTVTVPAVPDVTDLKPVIESAVATEGKITITITALDGAVSYTVYRSATATGTKTTLGTTTGTTYEDTTVAAGKKYFYFVKATGADGKETAYSAYKAATALKPVDVSTSKPVIESAVATEGKITITITALDGAVSYTVYRSATATGTKTTLGTTTGTTYEDTTVAAGKKYFYFVKATGADGKETAYSAYKAATALKPVDVSTSKPVIESAVATDGKITITITALDGAVSYTVYRSATATGTKTTLGTTTGTTYEDTTVAAGKKYFYFVKATGADGKETAYSAYKAATALKPVDVSTSKPVIESAVAADGKVTVTITALDGAASYTVYRSTTATGTKTTLGTATGTSYEDATVEAGKKYFYFVKATGADVKETEYSAYKAVTVPAAPDVTALKPVIESAVAADGKVTVTITALDGAASYTVYRSTTATGTKTTLGTVTGTSYEDATVEAGKKYFYFVKATGADGKETEYSAYKAVTVPAAPDVTALKPVIESAVAADGKVTVTITALDGAASYTVYRSTTATGTKTTLGTATGTSYEDATVEAGKKYFYFVKATGEDGADSEYSAYKAVTVPAAPTAADAKPEIASADYADGKVTVTITALDGAASYTVYRSTTATGIKTTLGTATGTSYEDATVEAGKKYFYFVKATGADGADSEYSAYKAVTIPAAPTVADAKPEIASATFAGGKVTITITTLDDAASYTVYRSNTATGTKTIIDTITGTSCEDATVEAGKKYFYFVKATGADGTDSEYSAYKAITVPSDYITSSTVPVIGTTSVDADTSKVTIAIKSLAGAEKYMVYRSTAADGAKNPLGETVGTSFVDDKAAANKTYYYFIKAVGTDGTESSFSAPVEVRVPPVSVSSSAKPVIESVVSAGGKVTITYTAVEGAGSYTVYRSTTATGTKTELGTTAALSYEDATAVVGTKYFYFVKATGRDGTSTTDYSSYKSITA